MTTMTAIGIVARWEFLRTVARIGFVATLLGLPLAHLGLTALIGTTLRDAVDDTRTRLPIALVDEHRLLAPIQDESSYVLTNTDAALDLLKKRKVEAVFVLDPEYLATGNVRAYAAPPKHLLQLGRHLSQRERVSSLLRRGLIRELDERSRRVVDPLVTVDTYHVDGNVVTAESPFAVLGVLAGPFGVCFVLGLAIFLSANLLQQAMSAELQNRMLEVLLTLITPAQLLAGKVLGLSAAGLLQVSAYLLSAAVAMPALVGTRVLSLETIFWSGAIFLAGFALFATILAGTGALVRDAQEHTQIVSVCFLVAAAPFFFLTHISGAPSLLARILTWFPPTAPVTLLLRIGSEDVGIAERCCVLVLIILSSGFVLKVSASLFKRRMLSGQAVSVRRLVTTWGGRS
jgi:ABC-2 type transport system permease protein